MPPAAAWPSLVPGPATITWCRAGDVRVLTAAGYALVLQVAHPTVGAGVSEHSNFRADPWGRLMRTLDYACTMVYAGPDAAGEMGRAIRAMHRRIRGTLPGGGAYSALEPEAYAWVHATLAEGIVRAHERFGRPFTAEQCEQLWAEWRSLGRLLGIRPGDLPPDWRAFADYVGEMIDGRLQRTAAVTEVLDELARPAPPELTRPFAAVWPLARVPLAHVVGLTTAGLLPPALRRRLGVRFGRRDAAELAALGAALRTATPLMPASLLNTGPGYLRWRSEALAGDRSAQGADVRPGVRRGARRRAHTTRPWRTTFSLSTRPSTNSSR
jgi:uncharacterized protein (DUF2236 family)